MHEFFGSDDRTTNVSTMRNVDPITCLFLDIGGVLLNDGWGHHARKRAATHFKLDWADMQERHALNFNLYEEDKLSLEEYLGPVVFHQKRSFTRPEFCRFMFAQSKPCLAMIELVRQLKAKYGLKIIVLSNEARELNAHRIQKFQLGEFVDVFVSSCFVHLHKPDKAIFRLALDIAQTPIQQILYIENTPMFVQIAEGQGICGVLHIDYNSTCAKLSAHGLKIGE
jgi:putative hydrolase of the HAD superfamily